LFVQVDVHTIILGRPSVRTRRFWQSIPATSGCGCVRRVAPADSS